MMIAVGTLGKGRRSQWPVVREAPAPRSHRHRRTRLPTVQPIRRPVVVALNDIPLGDPGFLAPALLGFARRRAPRSRLGIVCHYVDRRNPILQRMLAQDGVADLNVHAPPEEFLERMADCVAVASSSLHGLIFAEALGIPNLWLRAGNEIGGGDFKYLDWFTTTRHPQNAAHQLVIEDTAEALASRVELHDSMIDVHALAASFPYGQLDALRATAGTPISVKNRKREIGIAKGGTRK
jgi:hypothetical protein